MMVESVIAVFVLGAIAGGGLMYLGLLPTLRLLQHNATVWKKRADNWEEQAAMRSKLLNAVLKLARDAGALDAVTGEAHHALPDAPRLTIVKP
jgi:predicted alternative tryptophan synthase beta-subunit